MNQQADHLRVAVILAGGVGERFWPLSRHNRPKQLLTLNRPDKTILSETIERSAQAVGLDKVFLVTGAHLVEPICAAEPHFPRENVLVEPSKRNTLGALVYAATWLAARFPQYGPENITIAVITEDRIDDEDGFQSTISKAFEAAEQHRALVTCGVPPTRPETGFGYIEVDDGPPLMAEEGNSPAVYRVKAFHEKPDAARAAAYAASDRYFWNSGMFYWTVSTFFEELKAAKPEMGELLSALTRAHTEQDSKEVHRLFNKVENISVDYALMEKSAHVLVVEAAFPWADVGAWNAISTPEHCDTQGNCTKGNPILIDCRDCTVYNAPGSAEMAVAVIGMSDVVVVTTEDAVLVMPASRAQEVRSVVRELKRRKAPQV